MNSISRKSVKQNQRQDFCYHTHTYRCGHAENVEDEKYVKQAIKAGIKRLAFTDHMPSPNDVKTTRKIRMDMTEMDSYLESIEDLKEKYKGKIEIESGFEFEYTDTNLEHLLDLRSKADKMILGQHYVIGNNGEEYVFRNGIVSDEVLDLYAESIIEAIDKGLPDIIAHPDRFMISRKSFGEKEEQISRLICQKVAEAGIPLEINMGEPLDNLEDSNVSTDELRKKVSYPLREFWKIVLEESQKAVKRGKEPIKVVYGKDAHSQDRMSETKDYELTDKIIGTDILKQLYFVKSDLKTYNDELVKCFYTDERDAGIELSSEVVFKLARDPKVALEKENASVAITKSLSTQQSKETEKGLDQN